MLLLGHLVYGALLSSLAESAIDGLSVAKPALTMPLRRKVAERPRFRRATRANPRPSAKAAISRVELGSPLGEFLQRGDGFTGFRTYGVIRAHISAANHALLVNDVACGHRQAEGVFAVELVQLVSELHIHRFQVIGKCEYEAKLSCYLQPTVGQYIETQIEATMNGMTVLLQLRRDCHQASS
jgi:hypothetical protein